MPKISNDRPQHIPNLYWQPGHPVGAPVKTFRQIKYLPLPNALLYLDQALSGARLDCAKDHHKQLIEFGGAAKVWMTVQVKYETVNPLVNKQPFEQYLSALPTRIFRRDGTVTAFANPYIESLRILTDRIREFNAKFIRVKSGLRLARVLQVTLKMVKYAPFEGRGWQPLPDFLSKKGNNQHSKPRRTLFWICSSKLSRKCKSPRTTLLSSQSLQRKYFSSSPYLYFFLPYLTQRCSSLRGSNTDDYQRILLL